MKLHLGCGKKILPGYVNIDLYNPRADVEADVRTLPYADDSIDEILAVHVLEHIWLRDVPDLLRHWYELLVKDGKLILELPCLDKLITYIKDNEQYDVRRILWPMYGEPTEDMREEDLHKWFYTFDEARKYLKQAGFGEVRYETPHFHVPDRDMRIVATK